jgi:hypothetical protein
MPKRLIYEGSAECEAIRVIHSNPLQENATYRVDRRAPESGDPIRAYLEKTGDDVQPGDPVIINIVLSGLGVDRGYGQSPDNSEEHPTRVEFEVYPPEETYVNAIWPVETQLIPAPDPDVSGPGYWLQKREQRPDYRPGISDAEIEAHYYFSSLYDSWLDKRADDYYRDYDIYPPPPPEDYEIEGQKLLILAELRAHFSVQWQDWDTICYAWEIHRYGGYWPSPGRYERWDIFRQPTIEHSIVSAENGRPVNPGGSNTYTLFVHEFVDQGGDRNIETDWDEILRVNFSGTPEPVTIECDDTNCPNHCIEIVRPEDKAWKCICSSDDLPGTPIAETPNRIERKPPPDAPDPPPLNLGQRKAKARDYIKNLQPKFDKAKAKYKEAGDLGEAAHNLHRAQDAIAKDPARSQSERDAAAAAAAAALLDRDDAIAEANQAAGDMLDARRGLDALHDFVGQNPDDDGPSVGTALPPQPGWRPPLVLGGNGWNSTPTYINNNPEKSNTQVFGPSGGIQPAQVQSPTVIGGGGFQDSGLQSPQVVGGGGFVTGQWNATPTAILETQEEIISQIITEE